MTKDKFHEIIVVWESKSLLLFLKYEDQWHELISYYLDEYRTVYVLGIDSDGLLNESDIAKVTDYYYKIKGTQDEKI